VKCSAIADVDADPQAELVSRPEVPRGGGLLHRRRAGKRLKVAVEGDHQAVAEALHDLAAMRHGGAAKEPEVLAPDRLSAVVDRTRSVNSRVTMPPRLACPTPSCQPPSAGLHQLPRL
jgi:hypothetical protein